jgi:hypothetical protein
MGRAISGSAITLAASRRAGWLDQLVVDFP